MTYYACDNPECPNHITISDDIRHCRWIKVLDPFIMYQAPCRGGTETISGKEVGVHEIERHEYCRPDFTYFYLCGSCHGAVRMVTRP